MAGLLSELVGHGAVGSSPMSVDDIVRELESGTPPPLAFGISSGTALPHDVATRLRQFGERCRPPEPVTPEVLADYKVAAERVEPDLVATLDWGPAAGLSIGAMPCANQGRFCLPVGPVSGAMDLRIEVSEPWESRGKPLYATADHERVLALRLRRRGFDRSVASGKQR